MINSKRSGLRVGHLLLVPVLANTWYTGSCDCVNSKHKSVCLHLHHISKCIDVWSRQVTSKQWRMAIIRSPFRHVTNINLYEPVCFHACWKLWKFFGVGGRERWRIAGFWEVGRSKFPCLSPTQGQCIGSSHLMWPALLLAPAPFCDENEGGQTGWGRKGG